MKEISIRELHEKTGRLVREAAKEPYVVTDRGRPVARIVPLEEKKPGRPLPDREEWIKSLSRIPDSTDIISEDRDRGL